MREWNCRFCEEKQEGYGPKIELCKKCMTAWRELVLERKGLMDAIEARKVNKDGM